VDNESPTTWTSPGNVLTLLVGAARSHHAKMMGAVAELVDEVGHHIDKVVHDLVDPGLHSPGLHSQHRVLSPQKLFNLIAFKTTPFYILRQCIGIEMKYFSRVLRIFQRRLHNMTELSEDQIRIILGCLFAALTEAMAELVDELKAEG